MSTDVRTLAKLALAGLISLSASACATGSWMGAEKEKAYDKELEGKRLAEGLNNDDYYELMHEGRVLVFSDAKDYKVWRKTGEIPLAVTKFRAGPNGEAVKFSLTKNETKAMEKKVGYKGGSQNLYEGNVQGLAKGFFGFVKKDSTYYVFNDWNALQGFKKSGTATGYSDASGPEGAKVVYVGVDAAPAELAERFGKLHDGQ